MKSIYWCSSEPLSDEEIRVLVPFDNTFHVAQASNCTDNPRNTQARCVLVWAIWVIDEILQPGTHVDMDCLCVGIRGQTSFAELPTDTALLDTLQALLVDNLRTL